MAPLVWARPMWRELAVPYSQQREAFCARVARGRARPTSLVRRRTLPQRIRAHLAFSISWPFSAILTRSTIRN
ncbi:hypothetical protein CEXT_202191 [Caerostris extrusa]|uniref:Uncharacterized protein n=1 Tax=Caerostris extrusa TaxID=172846 RepID=A0AAV4T2E9_CAEEX|nr:hypothetical protein CEXT_202191 [Caerostris extrusa]